MSPPPTWSNALVVEARQSGGCVLVMRHASAPISRPDARGADGDNTRYERQLDDRGKACALAIGEAIRQLRIRVEEVFSSPTYRARETVRLAGFTGRSSACMQTERSVVRAVTGSNISACSGMQRRACSRYCCWTHCPGCLGTWWNRTGNQATRVSRDPCCC